jgi:hypothetical protein
VGKRDLTRARKLFFDYDGSGFYMSRDGVDVEYERYGVPPDVERAWLEELAATKLELLARPGNWHVVHFLLHHGDTRHLTRLVEAKPLGVVWERCAYLETLLKYVDICSGAYDADDLQAAVEQVLSEARALTPRVRSARSSARVGSLVAAAERRVDDLSNRNQT